ncbi:PEP-CTERM sorting domain-containing protein [Methylobacillus glycogenes]|uniref:PEP-CTERM sorting domain-containing protein n=1 Tax=Methylobacillus glycogenes TaxID=406 RepID=UPI000472BB0A|nr:PEP-CTERM sorting domain-containing protein [Methylobacillus glycogenes]
MHFRALGQLNYWSPESQSWGVAGNNANITLYGGIPVDAWLNYMLNPGNATYAAQYQYYANGTVFGGNGVSGPVTALIDGAGSNGSFHSHLDWKVSDAAAAGVYMLTLQVWSPTLENGVQKYLDSDPFHVVFKTAGISQAQFDQAFDQRIAVAVPEPESYALLLLGLAVVGLSARRRKALI